MFHEGKPSIVFQISAGIVKHQQGLAAIGIDSHDWCHGVKHMVREGFESPTHTGTELPELTGMNEQKGEALMRACEGGGVCHA